MRRATAIRPGEFTPIPHKMYLAAKRKRCSVCQSVYGQMKCFETSDKVFVKLRQHIHHLLPRRWLNEHGIHEHPKENLLSVCDVCHGRAKVVEDRLFVADLMGFMEGMRRINFPVRKIAEFAVSIGLTEFQRWLI